jgi:hypothetical protein
MLNKNGLYSCDLCGEVNNKAYDHKGVDLCYYCWMRIKKFNKICNKGCKNGRTKN